MTSTLEWGNTAETSYFGVSEDWDTHNGYRVHLLITQDGDNDYSAIVLNLPPGLGGCGQTMDDAVESAIEAVQGSLEVYAEDGQTIPWRDVPAKLPAGIRKTVIVRG